jgi:hypothetical protein
VPFKDPEKAKAYSREQSAKRYGPKRREYERERKRRKRLEAYEALPEPERTQALSRLRGKYDVSFNRY